MLALDELRKWSLSMRKAEFKELCERKKAVNNKVNSLSKLLKEEIQAINPRFRGHIRLVVIYADYSHLMRGVYIGFKGGISTAIVKQALDNLGVDYDGYIEFDKDANLFCFNYKLS